MVNQKKKKLNGHVMTAQALEKNGLDSGRKSKQMNGHVNGLVAEVRDEEEEDRETMITQIPTPVALRDAATSPILMDDVPTVIENGNVQVWASEVEGADGETAEAEGETEEEKPCCSASNATQTEPIANDALLAFLGQSEWERIETMCEMVACLAPFQLRLLGACVEGIARTHSGLLRPQEARVNSPNFLNNVNLDKQYPSYSRLLECTFAAVSLLHSTNRQGAGAVMLLIKRCMVERVVEMKEASGQRRASIIDKLGMIVSASIHHPAFSIDQRVMLVDWRTVLAHERDTAARSRESSPSEDTLAYVKRFEAQLPVASSQNFPIEIEWNDGVRSFVGLKREQICHLHHKLLDEFGVERGGGSGHRRILPYLQPDATKEEIVSYVNGLSDLPARMMLSNTMYEEFYSSRQLSSEVESSPPRRRDSPSPLSAPVAPQTNGQTASTGSSPPLSVVSGPAAGPAVMPVPMMPQHQQQPMLMQQQFVPIPMHFPHMYAPNIGPVHVVQYPVQSCSNCAGPHQFAQCPHPNFMQIIAGGEYRMNYTDEPPKQGFVPYVPPPRRHHQGGGGGGQGQGPPPSQQQQQQERAGASSSSRRESSASRSQHNQQGQPPQQHGQADMPQFAARDRDFPPL